MATDNEQDSRRYYFCVRTDTDDDDLIFKTDDNLEALESWANNSKEKQDTVDEPDVAEIGPSKNGASLHSLLMKVGKTGEQQSGLIDIVNVVGRTLPKIAIQNSLVSRIVESREKVRYGDGFDIYEVLYTDVPGIIKELQKASTMAHGLSHLPGAILLSFVGTFDSQMSDLVRVMLSVKSDKLKHGNKTMSLSRILAASSIEELVSNAINDEVYQFSRNSHDDQLQYIEDSYSVSIRKDWKRWPDLIEIFERRNLVAHGETSFTQRYVDACKSHGHKGTEDTLGTPILVTIKYLRQCQDILSECAILTIFSVWRKHLKNEEEEAFGVVLEVAFNAITSGQYRLAAYVCEYVLSLKGTTVKEATRLRYVVNLASAYLHLEQESSASAILDKVDWSATSDDFRICVAALRKDIPLVCELMPLVKATSKLQDDDYRSWPVFDFIKDDEAFKEAFESCYNSGLVVSDFRKSAKISTNADQQSVSTSIENPQEDTRH